eukprot:Gb_12114 [translate_table: standard]
MIAAMKLTNLIDKFSSSETSLAGTHIIEVKFSDMSHGLWFPIGQLRPTTLVTGQKHPRHAQSPQRDIRHCLDSRISYRQDSTQLSKRHPRCARKGPLRMKRGDSRVRRDRLITSFFDPDRGVSTLDAKRDTGMDG